MSNSNIKIRDEEDINLDKSDDKQYKTSRNRNSNIESVQGEYPNNNGRLRWKNRRRMAWISLGAIIAVTGILLFGPIENERLKILSDPITWFYFAMASIIGAYMGFTSYADKGRR